uniref:Uncharacterized protein n=1 Tax=Glossina austeni TaxID=7395 RepID=A0A1A9V586_GLOAU
MLQDQLKGNDALLSPIYATYHKIQRIKIFELSRLTSNYMKYSFRTAKLRFNKIPSHAHNDTSKTKLYDNITFNDNFTIKFTETPCHAPRSPPKPDPNLLFIRVLFIIMSVLSTGFTRIFAAPYMYWNVRSNEVNDTLSPISHI